MGQFTQYVTWPMWLIIGGAILSIVGTVSLTVEQKQSANKNLTRTITEITGGENYCYFDFHEFPKNTMQWLIQHGGPGNAETPVLGVHGEIINLTMAEETRKREPTISEESLLRRCTRRFDIGMRYRGTMEKIAEALLKFEY